MKKFAGDIVILHMCTKITIIWCMVPEIWSATHRNFCHYGPFFALLPLPPYGPRKSKFWKNEKILEDIVILQMFTINHSHVYGFSDMECNRQNVFVVLDSFLPFYPLHNPKNQNFENWKKTLEISSFYRSVPKIMITCYTVLKKWKKHLKTLSFYKCLP